MAEDRTAGSGRRQPEDGEPEEGSRSPTASAAPGGPARSGGNQPGQPVRGVLLLPRRWRHERARRPAAECVRHARRRRRDVRRRSDSGRFGGQLGGGQGHRPKTVASLGPDPSPDGGQQRAIADAVSLAELWLAEATAFPQVSAGVSAWSRAEWIEQTMPVWRRLVEPVAAHIADAMEGALTLGDAEAGAAPARTGRDGADAPADAADLWGQHVRPAARPGTGSTGDRGGRRDRHRAAAERARPCRAAADQHQGVRRGAGQTIGDVTLYLALRECARQRLFAAASWLREQMLALVEQYASGITIDTSALEQAVSQLDPSNLSELGQTLEGGLFEPQKTPAQKAVLERLETMLALVEGWVDEVVTQATAHRMPSSGALAETVRRARASGGPAEATFATLVGLELRPRRMRDATNLWAALRDARGIDGRDAVWSHPDLVPTSADLDDPLGFVQAERSATSR